MGVIAKQRSLPLTQSPIERKTAAPQERRLDRRRAVSANRPLQARPVACPEPCPACPGGLGQGAQRRISEGIVQDAAQQSGRSFVSVRFGNVLGSRGSPVLPALAG